MKAERTLYLPEDEHLVTEEEYVLAKYYYTFEFRFTGSIYFAGRHAQRAFLQVQEQFPELYLLPIMWYDIKEFAIFGGDGVVASFYIDIEEAELPPTKVYDLAEALKTAIEEHAVKTGASPTEIKIDRIICSKSKARPLYKAFPWTSWAGILTSITMWLGIAVGGYILVRWLEMRKVQK